MSLSQGILVTGGAGFIGSCFVRQALADQWSSVVVVDKLTYAGSRRSLAAVEHDPRLAFYQLDVADGASLAGLLEQHRPRAILHLAAESHVDRSIAAPAPFVTTNIVGTFQLLEAALDYWRGLDPVDRAAFRLLHVSTDEVYGSLGREGCFTAHSAYAPSSPYAASKAAADHLVRAYHRTYGLPVLVTHCSNNFGPYQFPEKLIPVMILNALRGDPLPVYGDGSHVRDWLYVEDHCRGLQRALERGQPGGTYFFGAGCERSNLAVVELVCDLVDRLAPDASLFPRRRLIGFVPDRPGHDFRYRLDTRETEQRLDWYPKVAFEEGLARTVAWYLAHPEWVRETIRNRVAAVPFAWERGKVRQP